MISNSELFDLLWLRAKACIGGWLFDIPMVVLAAVLLVMAFGQIERVYEIPMPGLNIVLPVLLAAAALHSVLASNVSAKGG